MFTAKQLQRFFEQNDLHPGDEKIIGENEVNGLVVKATHQAYSLGGFVVASVINLNRDGILISDQTWEDLYVAYCYFMTGLTVGADANNKNN